MHIQTLSVLFHKGFTNRRLSLVFFCSLSSLTSGDSNRCLLALCSATFCSLSFFFPVTYVADSDLCGKLFFEGDNCYTVSLEIFSSLFSFANSVFSLNFMEGPLVLLPVSFSLVFYKFFNLKVSTANKNILRQKTGMKNAPKHSTKDKIIIPKLSNPVMSNNLPIVFNSCCSDINNYL